VRVLAYHRVEPFRDLAWNRVSPGRFAAQMELLAARGLRVVPLGDLLAGGRSGEIAVTFDDALSGVVRYAVPVLERLGFRGTLFVPTAWVGRPNLWDTRLVGRRVLHASWKELERAAEAGWELGSHGHTHCDLTRVPDEEARRELEASRDLLAARLGVAPLSVAYPFGEVTERVARLAREAGYRWGCLAVPAGGSSDPFRVGRVGVRVFDGMAEFLAKVEGGPLYPIQVAKDRIAHFVSRGTPRIVHRIRRMEAPC
jgi:peptidoglycan/xylan/chitin deacetylase (PgdA/CDA1 family)